MTFRWPNDVPTLTDGVITLRAHGQDDLDLVHEMTKDPETLRWTAIPLDNTREDSRRFTQEILREGWERHAHRGWAIEAVDDEGVSKFAGNIDIRSAPIADIGWVLHPWARGRGIMQAAIALATDWAFTEGAVEIIHWRARVGNMTSVRSAIATGFTLHGVTPGILYEHGEVLDAWTGTLRFGDGPLPKHTSIERTRIDGKSVSLRALDHGDATRISEACSDPVSRQWIASLPAPYTAATARASIDEMSRQAALGVSATWAITDPGSDVLLGSISAMGLRGANGTSGEIGYWMHPDARGRGAMTEAVMLLANHCFAILGLHRLTVVAAAGNIASNKVTASADFRLVGTETEAELLGDGSYDNANIYELMAPHRE